MTDMFEALFGNSTVEKVLVYLQANGQGYGRLIAKSFGTSVGAVQQQLRRLENGNVIVGLHMGRTKIYSLNPHYPLFKELRLCFKKEGRRARARRKT